MKTKVILTIVMLLVVGTFNFVMHQVLVPEVGADLAVAQVTEDASGAGVRAVDKTSEYIDGISGLILIVSSLLIWWNIISDKISAKAISCKCNSDKCK